MKKHTPAPWTWVQKPPRDYDTISRNTQMPRVEGPNGEIVMDFGDCENYYPTEGTPPSKADGRLMVAAPEMLAALESILTYCRPVKSYSTQVEAFDRARELVDRLKYGGQE